MKRFWRDVRPVDTGNGWRIELDGRPIRTPARALLLVPTPALAEGIADEWSDCGDVVDPRAMPCTGLANAAIDRVGPDPDAFAAELARYGGSDLLCYRADAPDGLAERQARAWDPLLKWAQRRFDVEFRVTTGVTPVDQPEQTLQRLSSALRNLDHFELAGLSPLVTIGGSLIAALAIVESPASAGAIWTALTIDEQWQFERWGTDPEAERVLAARREEFLAAARFLQLLSS